MLKQPLSIYFFLGYRGVVHPPSDDEGTERTWFEPKQRPRNACLSDQSMASHPRKGQAKYFAVQPMPSMLKQPLSIYFFLGYRGVVHPPSDDEGTERTWFEPKQRPRKRVPKRSVHGKPSPQGASKIFCRSTNAQHAETEQLLQHIIMLSGPYSSLGLFGLGIDVIPSSLWVPVTNFRVVTPR